MSFINNISTTKFVCNLFYDICSIIRASIMALVCKYDVFIKSAVGQLCSKLCGLQSARVLSGSYSSKRNMSSDSEKKDYITPIEEARRFMIDCFRAVGTPEEHAITVADNLIEADYRGHYSHGMNRLEMYLRDIQGGMCNPSAVPTVENETCSTALVDGQNGMGAVVGKFCMDLAIKKAKETGIAMVAARESNHYGIAGIYALQAINEGLLGLSFTNTSPFMAPTRAKQAVLGTNPIALGAPGLKGDSFVLDMATTAVAVGKIELSTRKGEPIPAGWALNINGEVETNAEVAYKAATLMPLGGVEKNSGYKGYGLAMLVEIFCGILSGSSYGHHVRRWGAHSVVANIGHSFIAIDPKVFAPGFEGRLSDLMNHLRNIEPADPNKPVLVHGDPERMHMDKVDNDGGLRYVDDQLNTCDKLAREFDVSPMVSKSSDHYLKDKQ